MPSQITPGSMHAASASVLPEGVVPEHTCSARPLHPWYEKLHVPTASVLLSCNPGIWAPAASLHSADAGMCSIKAGSCARFSSVGLQRFTTRPLCGLDQKLHFPCLLSNSGILADRCFVEESPIHPFWFLSDSNDSAVWVLLSPVLIGNFCVDTTMEENTNNSPSHDHAC